MIERSIRSINSCGSNNSNSSSSIQTNKSKQPRTCMASTVALPVATTNSFRKLFASSGITSFMSTTTDENDYGSSNSSCATRQDDNSSIFVRYHTTSDDVMSLHNLCRNGHPKLEDIVWSVKMNSSCIEHLNDCGQYPLHVAVANAVMPEAIMYMILKFPKACAVPDIYGKLPLHYATSSSGWTIKNSSNNIFEANDSNKNHRVVHPEYMNMVRLMCKAHTGALVHEDNDGCNPIEYALLDDAPEELLRNLQRTSVNYQRTVRNAMLASQHHSSSRILPPSSVQCV